MTVFLWRNSWKFCLLGYKKIVRHLNDNFQENWAPLFFPKDGPDVVWKYNFFDIIANWTGEFLFVQEWRFWHKTRKFCSKLETSILRINIRSFQNIFLLYVVQYYSFDMFKNTVTQNFDQNLNFRIRFGHFFYQNISSFGARFLCLTKISLHKKSI